MAPDDRLPDSDALGPDDPGPVTTSWPGFLGAAAPAARVRGSTTAGDTWVVLHQRPLRDDVPADGRRRAAVRWRHQAGAVHDLARSKTDAAATGCLVRLIAAVA